jgi:DNA-binding HxlR family transcriptional regulator
VLTEQLRQLERDGIIRRSPRPEAAPRSEYQLTELGRSLRPSLNGLANWGKAYYRELGVELKAAE